MATIRDIANRAGVSRTAVSLVLNNRPGIGDEVRSRVLRVARELQYTPNRAAKSIATGRTHTIGVVTLRPSPRSNDFYSLEEVVDSLPSDIILGVEEGIQGSDYRLTFEVSAGAVESGLPRLVQDGEVDGVIAIGGTYQAEYLSMIALSGTPTVLTGSVYGGEPLGYIFVDTRAGIATATNHLLELGHTRIGFINGFDQSMNSADKLEGYKSALKTASLRFDRSLVRSAPFTADGGHRAALELLERTTPPSAIVTAFDGIAVGVLRCARAMGLRVPEDLSITGFEDGWVASHSVPALTTIRVPKREIGRLAVTRLRDVIDGDLPASFRLLLDPALIIRESTGVRGS